jgi:small subunit ribosomal protein S16
MGRAKRPAYSIVVVDSRKPRDSSFIEDLGRYYPLKDPAEAILQVDRAMHWLRTGAETSDTVRGIFSERGLMLRLHLERKGKSEEEIDEIVSEWKEDREEKETKIDVVSEAEHSSGEEPLTAEPTAEAEVEKSVEETEEEIDEPVGEAEDEDSDEREEAGEADEEDEGDEDEAEGDQSEDEEADEDDEAAEEEDGDDDGEEEEDEENGDEDKKS